MSKRIALFLGALLCAGQSVWAETGTASVSVVADLPVIAEVTATLDANSACTSASIVTFDNLDGLFSYQPPLGAEGANCFVLNITATGASTQLSAAVTGTINPNMLSMWFGGFFAAFEGNNNKGGGSGSWEATQGFNRILNEPFIGVAPVNLRLGDGFNVPQSGNATLTFTLVSL